MAVTGYLSAAVCIAVAGRLRVAGCLEIAGRMTVVGCLAVACCLAVVIRLAAVTGPNNRSLHRIADPGAISPSTVTSRSTESSSLEAAKSIP